MVLPGEQDGQGSTATAAATEDAQLDLSVGAGHIREFLRWLNLDTESAGLKDTPNRVARMYRDELCRASREDFDPDSLTTFPYSSDRGQYVAVSQISFHSLCEHHLVPFYGHANIVYHPQDGILGLSKFARVVAHFAAKPQTQELLTDEIADFLAEKIKPYGCFVEMRAVHLCMVVRGVKQPSISCVTSALRGSIDKAECYRYLGGS